MNKNNYVRSSLILIFIFVSSVVLNYTFADNKKYYHTEGPLRGSLINDLPTPVYSDNPDDSWNVIFHLLYTRTLDVPVSNFYYETPKPTIKASEVDNYKQWDTSDVLNLLRYKRFGQSKKFQRIIGGDIPEFYMRERSGTYLIESPRYEALINSLEKELSNSTQKNYDLTARILFQQDLWNRYDLLFNSEDIKEEIKQDRSSKLISLLGQTIVTIAPSDQEIKSLKNNLIKTAFSDLGIGPDIYTDKTPWREVLLISGNNLNPPIQETTSSHAEALGHRRVFRIFLKGPDDKTSATCLENDFNNSFKGIPACVMWERFLAYGSKAMLIETPLVFTKSGKLIHLPIILNIQLRTPSPVTAGNDGIYGFDDLPFSVFHASRRNLISQTEEKSALKKLPPDHPVPRNFSSFTLNRSEALLPLNSTCITCHGETGRNLMVGNRHGIRKLEIIHPANENMSKRVMDVKQGQVDFKSLLEYFKAH